jgi:hypothetical protein
MVIFNFQFSFREAISPCLPPSLIVLAKVDRPRIKFYALMPVNLIKNVNFVAEEKISQLRTLCVRNSTSLGVTADNR